MAEGESNIPIPGTLLDAEVKQRGLITATCWDYATVLNQIMQQNRFRSRMRVTSFNGVETHAVVEFYDAPLSKWIVADSTFGILYSDSHNLEGESLEELSAAVNHLDFKAIAYTLVTPLGDELLSDYYMDPWMYFLNPSDVAVETVNAYNDPHPFLVQRNLSDIVGLPGVYFFEFAAGADGATILDATAGSEIVSSVPNSHWAAATIFLQGWSPQSIPADLKVYTLPIYWTNAAAVQTPQDGETHVDASIPILFGWPQVNGAQNYRVMVGSSVGTSDIFTSALINGTYTQVPLKPQTTYYVRLNTLKEGIWYSHDTTFKTGWGIARIQSPTNGQTNVDATHSVEVTWSSVPNAQAYYLWVGTAVGASDVYNSGSLPTSTFSLSLNLQAGQTYYLRMFTMKYGIWEYGDSQFSTLPDQ
jgi:hypothetical protein